MSETKPSAPESTAGAKRNIPLQIILGFFGIAVVVYVFWATINSIISWVAAQQSQVAAAIIAFAGTIIAGIGAVIVSQQRTNSREIAEAHRPAKIKIYSGFIRYLVRILRDQKAGKLDDAETQKQLEDFFFRFTTNVMLWGSPAVLRHYKSFREHGKRQDKSILFVVDDILQAMRRDLGLKNWGLERGDLVKMLLTDPEALDSLSKGTK